MVGEATNEPTLYCRAIASAGSSSQFEWYTSDVLKPPSASSTQPAFRFAASVVKVHSTLPRYDAFMKAWGEAHEKQTQETVKTYPGMRKITGEYRLREITFK